MGHAGRGAAIAVVASVAALLAGPGAGMASAQEVSTFPVTVGGHTVTEATHADPWPSFPAGTDTVSGLEGPIDDPQIRRAAHFQAAVDGAPAAAAPRSGINGTPSPGGCTIEHATDDIANELTTLPRYKVIYAYPMGNTDRYAQYADVIQSSATSIANKIAAGDGNLRAPRFDYGTATQAGDADCGPGALDVITFPLAHPASYYSALPIDPPTPTSDISTTTRGGVIRAEINAARPGFQLESGLWNFLVLADGVSPANSPRGEGSVFLDDTPGSANANNRGSRIALIMGALVGGSYFGGTGSGHYNSADGFAYSVTHEVGHTLGTVQNSAPHTTGGLHCTDGFSIMCYNDGGPTGSQYVMTACTAPAGTGGTTYVSVPFDCGSDDYLNQAPVAGSYLASHWDVFDSAFMCDTNRCLSKAFPPTAVLADPGAAVAAGSAVTMNASGSSDRDGTIAQYLWDVDQGSTFPTDTGTTPTLPVTLDRAGTHVVRVRTVDADGYTTDSDPRTVTFTDRPPVAVLSVPATAAAGSTISVDARASSDPDANDRVASFVFADGRALSTSSASGVLSYRMPTAPGPVTFTVTVADNAGQKATASGTTTVPTPPPAPPPPTTTTTTNSGPTGKASVVSVRAYARGAVRVTLLCSKTGTGCSGSIGVRTGAHARDATYRLTPGQRVTKTIVKPSGVKVTRTRHPLASVTVIDVNARRVSRSIHLRL